MRRTGFTLLELVAVLSLISAIFALGVWSFSARRTELTPTGLDTPTRFNQWMTDASARARSQGQALQVTVWPQPGELTARLFAEGAALELPPFVGGDDQGWQAGTGWTVASQAGWEDLGTAYSVTLDAQGQPSTVVTWRWGTTHRAIWTPGAWPTTEAVP